MPRRQQPSLSCWPSYPLPNSSLTPPPGEGQTSSRPGGAESNNLGNCLEIKRACLLRHNGRRLRPPSASRARLALWAEGIGSIACAGALEPHITTEDLADIDLLKRVIVNLRGRHVPSVTLGHDRDLLFLAIRCGNRPVFGDLEIAVTRDVRIGRQTQCE